MTAIRRDFRSDLIIASLTALATWVTSWAWTPLMELPGRFIAPLLIVLVCTLLAGAGLRHLRSPAVVVLLGQLLVGAVVCGVLFAPSSAEGGVSLGLVSQAWADAWGSAAKYAAPIPAQAPSIAPLLITAGAALGLLGDFLVCTLRRPALVALPLLVGHLVPAAVTGEGAPWWKFAAASGAFLAVLATVRLEQVHRWSAGADLESRRSGLTMHTGALSRSAVQVSAAVIAIAIGGAWILPTWNVTEWSLAPGAGGSQKITIQNPIADLSRDLKRPVDVPMMRVRTTDPDPSYLRIAVLARFRNSAWSAGDRNFPEEQVASGAVPLPAGMFPPTSPTIYDYEIQALPRMSSTWLPTPTVLTEIQAAGAWKFDVATLDFLAADGDLNTAGLTYTAQAFEPSYDPLALAKAPPPGSRVPAGYSIVPADLPEIVRTLSQEVTAGQPTKFQEAQALQRWFRRDGGFRYSLETAPGTGSEALQSFLSNGPGGRTGYCEQFASAMAVMARTRGIPARVAIGFLRPERLGAELFEFSTHDLHAWPELYFSGAGWVRFEPTPGLPGATAPAYTTARLPESQPLPSVSAAPESARPSRDTAPRIPAEQVADDQDSNAWVWWAAGTAAVLVLIGSALLLPSAMRAARRRRRLHPTDPRSLIESGWAELRDTAIDLGRPWPEQRSPRETGDWMVTCFAAADSGRSEAPRQAVGAGRNPAAEESLRRLVGQLEHVRYAASSPAIDPALLHTDLEACRAALAAGVSLRQRRVARWWPRSAFP
ncbi:MAG: DUF3488 and transglutaminase-like domain-containing protein, partial [Nocardioides sp.]